MALPMAPPSAWVHSVSRLLYHYSFLDVERTIQDHVLNRLTMMKPNVPPHRSSPSIVQLFILCSPKGDWHCLRFNPPSEECNIFKPSEWIVNRYRFFRCALGHFLHNLHRACNLRVAAKNRWPPPSPPPPPPCFLGPIRACHFLDRSPRLGSWSVVCLTERW